MKWINIPGEYDIKKGDMQIKAVTKFEKKWSKSYE